MQYARKNVLITGASSGIGAALAREFAAQGAYLILLARRLELLREVAQSLPPGTGVEVHACDVTQADDLPRVVAELGQRGIDLDVVVANAGFGVVGNFVTLSLADHQRQFDTNVFGVIRTVSATLDSLCRRRGQLVLMGSIAGHVAQPGAASYAMSKFAVRALAEALRAELLPQGIDVTLLSPGIIESDLRRVDNLGRLHPQAVDPLPRWLRLPTPRAAQLMLRAIAARKPEQVITLHGKLVVALSRYAPGLLRWVFRHGLHGRPEPR